MNSNRSFKDPPPAPPAAVASLEDLGDSWGEDPEEVFDRPTFIPEVPPTEAELIASSLSKNKPWIQPPTIVSKNTSKTASELEFNLDALGSPPPIPPRGPGRARPISVQNLPPYSAQQHLHDPFSKPTPPAALPFSGARSERSRVDGTAVPLLADDPLSFSDPDDLTIPSRESFPDDLDLDFEALRNPKMREPPPSPAVLPPEDEEPHTAPYSFDLDPIQKHHTPGQLRQPPPTPSPTNPLEDFTADLFGTEGMTPLPPMMGDTQDPRLRLSPTERLLREMRDKFALGDFSGALEAAESLIEQKKFLEEANRFAENCKSRLCSMYEAKLGAPGRIPRLVLPPEQVRWLSLDHRAGFILSCVDGYSTIEEILDVSGMPPLDTLRILYDLLQQKVIGIP